MHEGKADVKLRPWCEHSSTSILHVLSVAETRAKQMSFLSPLKPCLFFSVLFCPPLPSTQGNSHILAWRWSCGLYLHFSRGLPWVSPKYTWLYPCFFLASLLFGVQPFNWKTILLHEWEASRKVGGLLSFCQVHWKLKSHRATAQGCSEAQMADTHPAGEIH